MSGSVLVNSKLIAAFSLRIFVIVRLTNPENTFLVQNRKKIVVYNFLNEIIVDFK